MGRKQCSLGELDRNLGGAEVLFSWSVDGQDLPEFRLVVGSDRLRQWPHPDRRLRPTRLDRSLMLLESECCIFLAVVAHPTLPSTLRERPRRGADHAAPRWILG